MSLWGCNCPLPALAACHRRGMVCRRLSLFSPLFRVWAWWCLRLGQAFRVVVIPQSGLVAQISLLRQHSEHSGQILTLSNASCASWPSPHLLRCGSYCWAHNLWVLIVCLFFLPVILPSVLPRLGTDSAVRVFPGVWKFLSF